MSLYRAHPDDLVVDLKNLLVRLRTATPNSEYLLAEAIGLKIEELVAAKTERVIADVFERMAFRITDQAGV
jgi:hypothetical protein